MLNQKIATCLAKQIAAYEEKPSLAALCEAHGLRATDAAALSRILRGEAVSAATLRRIGRALGCIPPPRRLIRRVLTPAQAQAWDRLTPEQRDKALGI